MTELNRLSPDALGVVGILKGLRTFLGNTARDVNRYLVLCSLQSGVLYAPHHGSKTEEAIQSVPAPLKKFKETLVLFPDRRAYYWMPLQHPVIGFQVLLIHVWCLIKCNGYLREFRSEIASLVVCATAVRNLDEQVSILVIADLSPELITLSCAFAYYEHETIAWQCDYFDPVRFPFEPTKAILKNSHGLWLSRKHVSSKGLCWQQRSEVRPMRKVRLNHPIGIVLMAFVSNKEIANISKVAELSASNVLIRPHPRTKLGLTSQLSELELSDASESLEDFADRCGLVLVGNSTAQLKVLQYGVPVVQVPGLDVFSFDVLGYVARGLVLAGNLDSFLNAKAIDEFYESPEWLERIERVLAQPPQFGDS